jgi:hypothetical protein
MKPILACSVLVGLATAARSQSMVDLVDGRNGARPYASIFEIEAGMIGAIAGDEDPSTGLEDGFSWDGHVYYRDEATGSGRGTVEAYAGRDGLFGGYTDGKLVGDDTLTRFEVRARPWMFYRDGFYRGDKLVQNGFYEGSDYEGYVGFGREAQPGFYIETGPFYKQLSFSRSDITASTFTIPEDYAAYGLRIYVEQSTVQMDRRRGMPREGFQLTVLGEREWNDSDEVFGNAFLLTKLPSAVWRLRGRLEWYVPSSEDATWEIFANGGWHDEQDRVQNFEGQRPLGDRWADAQLRLRFNLGASTTLTPFVHGQFSRVIAEDGVSATKDFFIGGGIESYVHLSDAFSLHGYYSYLDNENRPSIRVDEDLHGEHMFYLGIVMRFGSTRR